MEYVIRIVCFDINCEDEEDIEDIIKENLFALECPLRILDEFVDSKIFLESEKIQINSAEIKYIFQTNFSENKIIYEIYVLYDLSYIHEISLDADAYLLFLNLEKNNTMKQLAYIMDYIIECCSIDVKTYVIGMYTDIIIPSLNKESIELYLEEENSNYEYYQINCKENSTINGVEEKIVSKEEQNFLSNNKYKIKNNKNKSNFDFIDIILIILRKIYEIKLNEIYEPKHFRYSSFTSKEYQGKSESNSTSNCFIF